MTYFAFHLIFIAPALLVAGYLARDALRADARSIARAIAAVCGIAILYTTPWDQYLIARGIWTYDASRIAGTLGHVPIEEYAFFVLQPILASLVLLALGNDRFTRARQYTATSAQSRAVARRVRIAWTGFWLMVSVAGVLLFNGERTTYLALILTWAGPVLAAQSFLAATALARHAGRAALAVAVTTLYLSSADRVAIASGIWHIAEDTSTGFALLGLPLEEAVFFLVTNLLVVQGLLLFLHPSDVREALGRSVRTTAPARVVVVGARERP